MKTIKPVLSLFTLVLAIPALQGSQTNSSANSGSDFYRRQEQVTYLGFGKMPSAPQVPTSATQETSTYTGGSTSSISSATPPVVASKHELKISPEEQEAIRASLEPQTPDNATITILTSDNQKIIAKKEDLDDSDFLSTICDIQHASNGRDTDTIELPYRSETIKLLLQMSANDTRIGQDQPIEEGCIHDRVIHSIEDFTIVQELGELLQKNGDTHALESLYTQLPHLYAKALLKENNKEGLKAFSKLLSKGNDTLLDIGGGERVFAQENILNNSPLLFLNLTPQHTVEANTLEVSPAGKFIVVASTYSLEKDQITGKDTGIEIRSTKQIDQPGVSEINGDKMAQARFSNDDQFVLLDYYSKTGCVCRRTSNLQEPLFANESAYRQSQFMDGNKLLLQCPDNSWEIREFAKISEPGIKITASKDKQLLTICSSGNYSNQENKFTTYLFLILTDGTCEIRTLNQPTIPGTVIQAANGSMIEYISCDNDFITIFTAHETESRNINTLTKPGERHPRLVMNSGGSYTAFQHENDGTKYANLWELCPQNELGKPGIIIKNSELLEYIHESPVPNVLEFHFRGQNPRSELRAQDNPNTVILATINGQTIKAISHFGYSTAFKLSDGSWEIRKSDAITEPDIRLQSNFWKSVTEIRQYHLGSQDYFGLVKNNGTLTLAKQKNDLSPRQLLVAAIFKELSRSYIGEQILKSVEQELMTWFKTYPQSNSIREYAVSFFCRERSTQQATSSSSSSSASASACDSTKPLSKSASAANSGPVQAPATAPAQSPTLRSAAVRFLSWVNALNPFGA